MSLEIVLRKIREQIKDLAPALEQFVEDNVQPSVQDCERLQKLLNGLTEDTAVYKYFKVEKELSPSFSLHAKISSNLAEQTDPIPETPPKEHTPPKTETKAAPEKEKKEPVNQVKLLTISINDKFRFINELFAQNHSEYNIALEQLNNLRNWNETDIYLGSLKNLYGWKDSAEIVKYFYALVKRRFE